VKVHVECLGQLGRIAGKSVDLELGPSAHSVDSLLAAMAGRFGDEFRRIVLDEQGKTRPSLIVLVNGAVVAKSHPATLKDGDIVRLLPAIAGG